MLEELIKKKKKIEIEINNMSYIDRMRPEQRNELYDLEKEFKKIELQIASTKENK